MRILVTGGSGYLSPQISISLAKYFPQHHITCLSRFSKPVLPEYSNLTAQELNWTSPKHPCLPAYYDVLIHASAPSAKQLNNVDVSTLQSVLEQEYRLFSESSKAGIPLIISLSSIHVYGPQPTGWITTDSPVQKHDNYSLFKLTSEHYLRDITSQSTTKALVLRLSNTFGFSSPDLLSGWDLFLNNICHQLVSKHSITVRSNPNILRDFLPISYLQSQLCQLLDDYFQSPHSIPQFALYNMSTGYSRSLHEVASTVVSAFSLTSKQNIPIKFSSPATPFQEYSIIPSHPQLAYSQYEKIFANEITSLLEYSSEANF